MSEEEISVEFSEGGLREKPRKHTVEPALQKQPNYQEPNLKQIHWIETRESEIEKEFNHPLITKPQGTIPQQFQLEQTSKTIQSQPEQRIEKSNESMQQITTQRNLLKQP